MEAVIGNEGAAEKLQTTSSDPARTGGILTNIGIGVLRYGLVGILL